MKKRFSALLLTALIGASMLMPVSADEPEYSDSVDWNKFRGQNVTINVYNWGEYISVDDGTEGAYDTNREFEELTGIKVNYTNFASNEELYAKLKNGGSSYDVIIPSDYMIARMINEDMLEKLDFSNIPNYGNLIMDKFKGMEYDPTEEYFGALHLGYGRAHIQHHTC